MQFSLIVPVYNTAQYLPRCMDSLLAQDFQDFEIILVDDGSTDTLSPAMCDMYTLRAPRQVRVIHQPNGGLGAARNSGLDAACGEYVFFIDSDDSIAPGALSLLYREIQKTGADMYCFPLVYVEGSSRRPFEPMQVPKEQVLSLQSHPELLLETPSACLRVCRRTLFTDHPIRFPGRVWFEDLATIPKLLLHAESVVVLREPLYDYLLREGSIMHSTRLQRNLEILDALDGVRTYYAQAGVLEQYRDVLGILCLNNVLMAAQRVLMADPDSPVLPQFLDYMAKADPDYRSNPRLPALGRKKLLVLRLLEKKRYRTLRRLFRLLHLVRGKS